MATWNSVQTAVETTTEIAVETSTVLTSRRFTDLPAPIYDYVANISAKQITQ